ELSVLALQIFLIITAASLMLLAAALSELRRARTSALRRKESLALALNAAQMGAWEWNLATDRVTWRLGSGRLTKNCRVSESAAEALARVHHDDRGLMEAAMAAARVRGEADEVECRFVCSREVRWIRVLGKVQRDAAGMPLRVTGVCIDTTERRAQEMQEQSQRAQLAHLSRAATLGELSGALAHELSQPLAAILINAQAAQQELMQPTPNLDEISAILNDIAADDQRAGEVIRRLRALFVRGAVQKEEVDVGECIRSVLGLEHSDLIARNVVTELCIDPDLPPVAADRVQLQQVLLNLIMNACDAMMGNDSDRRLRIAASCEGGEVRIEVADNGTGVADLEHVFEPFYSTKKQGIGLGLTISRTIIGMHGGRLSGANRPGGGATFHVALPAAAVASDVN
ncbi:MAG TPA: ATP-binding protein, partial [Steroidobacteraceae bacterium]|nr:ATP-binding protein [Steroidobacteraceae bacterium]